MPAPSGNVFSSSLWSPCNEIRAAIMLSNTAAIATLWWYFCSSVHIVLCNWQPLPFIIRIYWYFTRNNDVSYIWVHLIRIECNFLSMCYLICVRVDRPASAIHAMKIFEIPDNSMEIHLTIKITLSTVVYHSSANLISYYP